MKRVSQATSAASCAKAASAVGSRSIAISVPVGPIRSATRRAWPPAPSVQSTAIWPARGSSASISSPARTGTCVWGMSRSVAKGLGQIRGSRREVGFVALPGGAVPELEAVADAGDHDLAADPGVLQELRRQHHAAGGIQLRLQGVPVEDAPQLATLLAERVAHLRQRRLRHRGVVRSGIERDAGIRRPREEDALAEVPPE